MPVVAECFMRRCKYYKGIFNQYDGNGGSKQPKVSDTCNAFPKGIPLDIIEGKNKHDTIVKGQTGSYLFREEKK